MLQKPEQLFKREWLRFKNHFYTDSASVKSGLRKRSTFDYPRALDSITE